MRTLLLVAATMLVAGTAQARGFHYTPHVEPHSAPHTVPMDALRKEANPSPPADIRPVPIQTYRRTECPNGGLKMWDGRCSE